MKGEKPMIPRTDEEIRAFLRTYINLGYPIHFKDPEDGRKAEHHREGGVTIRYEFAEKGRKPDGPGEDS